MNFLLKSWGIISMLMAFISTDIDAQNPNWSPPNGSNHQYSANVIATIKLSDVASDHASDVVAFFKGNQIKGLGNSISLGNGLYRHFITIYANQPIDTLKIKVYHHDTDQVYEVLHPFIFEAQKITGTLDIPYVINIYPDNNAPIGLLPVPPQQTIQGLPFVAFDMFPYLIQPDGYPVDWTYTPNPNLNVSFQGSVLHVSGVTGFTGQTHLIVRATEESAMAYTRAPGERYVPQTEFFAEVSIPFHVTPLYAAPLWQPVIPSQGIVLGGQFAAVSLHNYENQYPGPFIKYDYVPVIAESSPAEPKPSWEVIGNFGASMSVITKLNYTPKYQFHHEDDVLAAFVGNEVRGLAIKNSINGLYYLQVAGNATGGDTIMLKFYSGALKKVLTLGATFLYQPYAILGDDVAPIVHEFAPFVPMIPDTAVAAGITTMPVQIINPDFVGSMDFRFMAMDPLYPLYLRDETTATFCVVADSSELSAYYQDADDDGLGNAQFSIMSCGLPEGYVTNDDDCNDADPLNSGVTILFTENSGVLNDGQICSEFTTFVSVQQPAMQYVWNYGQTTQSFQSNPSLTIQYSVTVTFNTGCVLADTATLEVEGTVVRNSQNSGFGTLRNILECIDEGGTVTYDFPNTTTTLLTAELPIQKNVTIAGTPAAKPEISLDFNAALHGFVIGPNKTLTLNNVDLNIANGSSQKTVSGQGSLTIAGSTQINTQ
ncbi:MAG: hypothetical protein IPN29_05600 [Saprospiraceae bacterium]|nr:hypothetical protein [Saprospiraceae bacterium]